jgi:hypothetical protein
MSDYDITQGSPATVYSLGDSEMTYSLNSSISGNGASITGVGVPWITTTGSGTDTSVTVNPNWNNGTSSKIRLDGPGADIEINGESLTDMIRNIEQRLNILKPNEKLESEWDELRALGDAYRALEAKIEAKMKTWEAISK